MFYLVFLALSILFLYISLNRTLNSLLLDGIGTFQRLKNDIKTASRLSKKLKDDGLLLSADLEQTTALYDITKSLSNTLEEDKMTSIFKDKISRYLRVGDCQFLKAHVNLNLYKDYSVFPVRIDRNIAGYLVVKEIRDEDKDKFNILAQQFISAMKRAVLYKKVQELGILDGLTGIFNRRYFMERLKDEINRSVAFKYNLTLLMVDLDNFKSCNDRYGHLVGDVILREAARTIRDNIRQIDFMGRFGGEELAIVLTETDEKKAYLVAERIRQAVELKDLRAYDEILKVTISIGLATFPKGGADMEALVDGSDQALYLAKHTGKNRVCVFPPE